MRGVFSVIVLVGLVALGGCAVREPADPARLATGGDGLRTCRIDWPQRDPEAADQRIWMRPGKQRVYIAGLDDIRGTVKPYVWSGEVRVLKRERQGQGLLCEVKREDSSDPQTAAWYDPRVFMFYSSKTPVLRADRSEGPPAPGFEEMDGTPMDGIVYRLRPDVPGVAADRGIIVALRPLSGWTYIRPVINELRGRGWVVIESAFGFGVNGVGDKRDAQSDEELEKFGASIGALTNDRLSEGAYGCEAMLDLVRQERPELATRPVVVVGFSAGAIGAPTVAARLGERVKGVVLVGGGVDILRIAQTSSLSNFGLGVTYRGEPVRGEKLDRLCRAYLKAATLDSYNTAALLNHVPALVLQAAEDDIVPVDTGVTLYERLGRPERWVLGGGHEMLFLQLGFFGSKIADWVDANVSSADIAPMMPTSRTITEGPEAGPEAATTRTR